MTQQTLVLKVAPAERGPLRQRLSAGTFEFRPVPHAVFSVKGEGVVATLYESGKFVVQGAEPEIFLARWTDLAVPAGTAERPGEPRGIEVVNETIVGSDEAGKGDYFGPLVVAAVRVEPERAAELRTLGVADSKRIADGKVLRLAALLREEVPHAIRRLDPPAYNLAYGRHAAGLNSLLAEMHAQAIRELASEGDHVLVDKFANAKVMRDALAGSGVKLQQETKAERNVAVAAASMLARAEFLLGLMELSAATGMDFPKGAGTPVDRAGTLFVSEHGLEALVKVAKVHFKNTAKIEALVRR